MSGQSKDQVQEEQLKPAETQPKELKTEPRDHRQDMFGEFYNDPMGR